MLLLTTCPAARAQVAAPDSAAVAPLRVGAISIDVSDIFTEQEVAAASGPNRLLRRAMNTLHINTRPGVLRRELVFAEGDSLDLSRLAESERNLRSLGILNRISVAPADTGADGRVGVAITARETWTLGVGVNFALAGNGDIRWNLALTEKNFLGSGTVVQGSVGNDLDATYGGVYLRRDHALATPLRLEFNLDERSDGHDRWARVTLPFRRDDQRWSMNVEGWTRRYAGRYYLSNAGPAGVDPTRPTSLYALVPRDDRGVELEVRRLLDDGRGDRIWRAGLGLEVRRLDHQVGNGLFYLSDGRVADLGYLDEPGQPLHRDQGVSVWPYLTIASKSRTWVKTRFLQRYGNLEDVPIGPAWELRLGPVGPAMGATAGYGDAWRALLGASNWVQLGESFLVQSVSLDATVLADEADDRQHLADVLVGGYRRFGPAERPYTAKTFVEAVHGDGRRGDKVTVLGLDRGLRTLDIDGMAGDRLLRWSAEVGRVLPMVPLDLVQVGWGVFYSGGLARWQDEDRDLSGARHEIGAGLRFGGTRSGTAELARVDVTWDATGESGVVITTVSRGYF